MAIHRTWQGLGQWYEASTHMYFAYPGFLLFQTIHAVSLPQHHARIHAKSFAFAHGL